MVIFVIAGCSWLDDKETPDVSEPLTLVSRIPTPEPYPPSPDWGAYGGDAGHRQYSALDQINADNVFDLEPVWTYHSAPGYELPAGSELQINPLVVDGVLYGMAPDFSVFAIDAATADEHWRFNPVSVITERGLATDATSLALSHKRGFARWADKADTTRLYFGVGHWLFGIDAVNGELVPGFGDNGIVDLREGLGRPPETLVVSGSTPGAVYKDLLIVGSRVGEDRGAAPGDVRAYDVHTGEIRWTFHTIPPEGQPGSETWPADARDNFGGVNVWAGITIDDRRGLAFLPVGSPSSDFVGIDRPGDNLYGNSLVALNAADGTVQWHYQLVRHDLWDRDLNSAPTLVTVDIDGETVDAVAQTTKQGYVYVFNRDTGESLFPIQQIEVPSSPVRGEQAATSQPIPVSPPPFAKQDFDETDLTDISAEAHAHAREMYRQLQPAQRFAPFGPKPRIMMPGYDGGATWGGPAWSADQRLLIINAQNRPGIGQVGRAVHDGSTEAMLYTSACAGCHGVDRGGIEGAGPTLIGIGERMNDKQLRDVIVNGRGRMLGMPIPEQFMPPLLNYLKRDPAPAIDAAEESAQPVFTGYTRFVDQEGYPAVKPPWGTLTAIDLHRGRFAWQTILGEHPELTARGVPPTGTLNYGGPVATAGGLVFIAATMDSRLRAFDITTGEELWQAQLPAPAFSTPAVYAVDGRQYIAVACGGGKLGTEPADVYMAFALPVTASE